ncbi:MAG: transposase [Thermoguttaceae bacterium]
MDDVDETNFSLVPIIARTWAEQGHVPILYGNEKRTSETGVGLITLTPKHRILRFRFTIYPGSAGTHEIVYDLNLVHRYDQKTVVAVWDGLPAHQAAERYFQSLHLDWFVFHRLPPYSPELNPVEQCWNEMKNSH